MTISGTSIATASRIHDVAASFASVAKRDPDTMLRADMFRNLSEARDQARRAADLLADVPDSRDAIEHLNLAIQEADHALQTNAEPRIAAGLAAGSLYAIKHPQEAIMRDVLARDAATWTPDEITAVRGILKEGPQHLQATSGPYRFRGRKYSFPAMLKWLKKNGDPVDVRMCNRYAAAWLMTHDPAMTREGLMARAAELFMRDAHDWTQQEKGEVAAILNDLPEDLAIPTDTNFFDQQYRPYVTAKQSQVKYSMPAISEWLTISHDVVDHELTNQHAEAWLATKAPDGGSAMLAALKEYGDTGTTSFPRTPTSVSLELFRDRVLDDVDGWDRALRAANLLPLVKTREQVEWLLKEITDSLPETVSPDLQPMLEETKVLLHRNAERNLGRADEAEFKMWKQRGFSTHVDFGELGTIQSNIAWIDQMKSAGQLSW